MRNWLSQAAQADAEHAKVDPDAAEQDRLIAFVDAFYHLFLQLERF